MSARRVELFEEEFEADDARGVMAARPSDQVKERRARSVHVRGAAELKAKHLGGHHPTGIIGAIPFPEGSVVLGKQGRFEFGQLSRGGGVACRGSHRPGLLYHLDVTEGARQGGAGLGSLAATNGCRRRAPISVRRVHLAEASRRLGAHVGELPIERGGGSLVRINVPLLG